MSGLYTDHLLLPNKETTRLNPIDHPFLAACALNISKQEGKTGGRIMLMFRGPNYAWRDGAYKALFKQNLFFVTLQISFPFYIISQEDEWDEGIFEDEIVPQLYNLTQNTLTLI